MRSARKQAQASHEKFQAQCVAIIVAAGLSRRMGGINKSLALIGGRSVIVWSLEVFEAHPLIDRVVLVAPRNDIPTYEWLACEYGISKVTAVIPGGSERQASVQNGLRAAAPADVIVVHNGANPFVCHEEITAVIVGALEVGAAAVGEPASSTLHRVDDEMLAQSTVPRDEIWCMQTPQALRYELAVEAFERAALDDFHGTDDIQLVERLSRPARVCRAGSHNVKITTRADLELADAIIKLRNTRQADR